MTEPRNTILQLPDTLEYIRAMTLDDGDTGYSLCTDRSLATPFTKDEADYLISYYQHMYMVNLKPQDWIILNAKYNPDADSTEP